MKAKLNSSIRIYNCSPFLQQMVELSYRESQSIIRNTAALIARFGITIFLNLLYGCIFLNAGQGDNADTAQFQAHYGSVTFVMISAMFGSAQPVMLAFPFERPMFLREHSTGTCKLYCSEILAPLIMKRFC